MGVWGESLRGREWGIVAYSCCKLKMWQCTCTLRTLWPGTVILTEIFLPFWGIVGLVSTIKTLQDYSLRPFRFTPVMYHVAYNTVIGTAGIAQWVLWVDSGLDDWEILVRFLVEQEMYLLFKESRLNPGSYPASSAVGKRDSLSLGQSDGAWNWHFTPICSLFSVCLRLPT